MTHTTLAFIQNLGYPELLLILGLGVLLFGKRLPEVGRSLGKGIVEFKRGLKDVNKEIDTSVNAPETSPPAVEQQAKQPLPEGDSRRVSQAEPAEQIPQGSPEPNSNG